MNLALLSYAAEDDSLSRKVATATMQFAKETVEGYTEISYTDDDSLIEALQTAGANVVLTTPDIERRTALLLKSLHIVIVTIGTPSCADEVDICIDPLRSPREHGMTGPAYLLPNVLSKEQTQEVADSLRMPLPDFQEAMACGDAQKWLPMIFRLVRKLDWDTEFFGFAVGLVSSLRFTPAIEKVVEEFMKNQDITLMEYLCDCHDRESILTAEKAGFSFVDMRLTFGRKLQEQAVQAAEGVSFRLATKDDIPVLKNIAHDAYKDSRYYFDGNFDQAKLIEFYESWAEKAVLGAFDDYALVAELGGEVVGFVSISKESQLTARIGLLGLHPNARGKGIGMSLLQHAFSHLHSEGFRYVTVVTQGRNYAAQRLYQKCGFLTEKTELWYHKWR